MKNKSLVFALPFLALSLSSCFVFKNKSSEEDPYRKVSYEEFFEEAERAHIKGHSFKSAIVNGYYRGDYGKFDFNKLEITYNGDGWVMPDTSSSTMFIIMYVGNEAINYLSSDERVEYYIKDFGFKILGKTDDSYGYILFNKEGLVTSVKSESATAKCDFTIQYRLF